MLFFFNYETPMFSILVKGDELEARKVLRRIYREDDVSAVIEFIKETNTKTEMKKKVGFGESLLG